MLKNKENICFTTVKIGSSSLLILSFLWLSQPVNIASFQANREDFFTSFPSRGGLTDYYQYLEEDTLSYKLLLKRLNEKEEEYFHQMRPFITEIVNASQKTGVPMASIAACIKRESQFDPGAISNRGAYGLMGVTIWAYHDVLRLRRKKEWIAEILNEYGDLTWTDVKNDPGLNILVGTIYYKFLLNEFKDSTLAFLAYNWGIGNVQTMQVKYGDTENILGRLDELASWNSAWIEPARYPSYISSFKTVFHRVDRKIEITYATERKLWENLALSSITAPLTDINTSS